MYRLTSLSTNIITMAWLPFQGTNKVNTKKWQSKLSLFFKWTHAEENSSKRREKIKTMSQFINICTGGRVRLCVPLTVAGQASCYWRWRLKTKAAFVPVSAATGSWEATSGWERKEWRMKLSTCSKAGDEVHWATDHPRATVCVCINMCKCSFMCMSYMNQDNVDRTK